MLALSEQVGDVLHSVDDTIVSGDTVLPVLFSFFFDLTLATQDWTG